MKINKLKHLILSLFLNNAKSLHLQSANGNPYIFQKKMIDKNIIQGNNRQSVNGTILEYMLNQNIEEIIYCILSQFISEMVSLHNFDNCTFTIQNNFKTWTATYQVTNQNNLIKIERVKPTSIKSVTIYDNINYTVLALSSMYSPNMQSFLEKNAARDIDIPSSNVYIHNGYCLVINNANSSYYIFPAENNIEIKDKLRALF